MSLKQSMNTKIKKGIINGVIFLFFVTVTFYVIFKNNDIVQILEIVKQVDKKFICLAILCMCFFVFAEGINILRTLKLLDCKTSFKDAIKYALVGFFFSSVTPSASGGDPMQIYYMKKDGLPLGKSTLAILTEFSSFQIVTILMAVVGFVTNYKFIENSIGNVKYFLLLGVTINVIILGIIILSIFSKKLIIKLVNLICKILNKFHYKKTEGFETKCFKQIEEYKTGASLLIRNPKILLKIVSTTVVQIVLYHSIPYLIYLSFGLGEVNFFRFLALQAVLYISVSSIPLPGAVGISEGGFLIIYKILFPATLLSSAMLLSRGISFYLFVVISGISVLCFSIKKIHN